MTPSPSSQGFVPAHKHDLDAVARARAAGYPAIAPALPGLLKWLQDMNWPVARPVLELLVSVGEPVVPHVLGALRGDDAIWKSWLLTELVPRLDISARAALLEECTRLANEPGSAEILEEVPQAAMEIILRTKTESPVKP